MPSRMDRYYRDESTENRRVKKNERLYKSIYENTEYSNIEGIASISKKGEIDLEKLKEMLEKREQKEKERKYRTATVTLDREETREEENKNYDIRDVLVKAKTECKEDNSHRSLSNVDYDFLKSLNLNDLRKNEEEDDLKTLADTLTRTNILNQMDNEALSLDMLSELKPTGNTVADNESIRKLIEEEIQKTRDTGIKDDIDQSFFTTSNHFKAEDFESLEEMKTSIKKSNKLIHILVCFIGFVLVIIVGYFIVKLWK